MSNAGTDDGFQPADETLVDRGFRVQDPAVAFADFSQVEIPRLRDTLPEFDEAIFQEAVALTLARLRPPPPSAGDEA